MLSIFALSLDFEEEERRAFLAMYITKEGSARACGSIVSYSPHENRNTIHSRGGND